MRSYYQAKVYDQIFDVDTRYTNLQLIGRGAYGAVASAFDTKNELKVAIKKISCVFESITKAKRILREIKLLRYLNGHENIIQIYDVMTYPNTDEFKDVYIVTTLFETDLEEIISSKQPLSKGHLQFFLYQLLRGTKYIHSADILHRDLKPSNILVNANCDLAICDFGLARGLANLNTTEASIDSVDESDVCMTEYVVTRYYRAPELLCEAAVYDTGIDIWSIGCVFAELICREPLFLGKSPLQQLQMIAKLLPCPPSEELEFAQHDVTRHAIDESRKEKCELKFKDKFRDVDKRALDLLQQMLVIQPKDRYVSAFIHSSNQFIMSHVMQFR